MTTDLSSLINFAGYAAFIVGGVLYARSKVPGQTITNYKALTEAQEKRIAALEEQTKVDRANHLENVKALADLQGQIKVYKELPLQEISTAIQKIDETLLTMTKIITANAEVAHTDHELIANEIKEAV